jgi:hypothetical protein
MRLLLAFTFALWGSAALRAEIVFTGVLSLGEKTLVALTDTATEKTEWRAAGQSFAGHTIRHYDRATDSVTLVAADGTERCLKLHDARIKSAPLELAGTISLGAGEKIEVTRATLVFDAETVFPLKDGIVYRVTPRQRPDGTILFETAIERTLAPNASEKISFPRVLTLPGQEFRLVVGDYSLAFTPRTR